MFSRKAQGLHRAKAQGTIEYLVIVAVVIVVALVVVGLMTNILGDTGGNVTTGAGQISNAIGSGGLVISDAVVDSSGNSILSINNSTGDILTITGVNTGTGGTTTPVNVTPGDTVNLNFDNLNFGDLCVCAAGQASRTCNFSIQVTRPSGLSETYNRTVTVQCITNSALRLTRDSSKGPLITGQEVPSTGVLGHSLVDASGNAITTQAQLDAAIANGDLNIYYVSSTGGSSGSTGYARTLVSASQYNNPVDSNLWSIGCFSGKRYVNMGDYSSQSARQYRSDYYDYLVTPSPAVASNLFLTDYPAVGTSWPNAQHPELTISGITADVGGFEFTNSDGTFSDTLGKNGMFMKITSVGTEGSRFSSANPLNKVYKMSVAQYMGGWPQMETLPNGDYAHVIRYIDYVPETNYEFTYTSSRSNVVNLNELATNDGTAIKDFCTMLHIEGTHTNFNGRELRNWYGNIYRARITLGSSGQTPVNGEIIVDPVGGKIVAKNLDGSSMTSAVNGYLACADTNFSHNMFDVKACCTAANCCNNYYYTGSGSNPAYQLSNCTVDLDNNCSAFSCTASTCTQSPLSYDSEIGYYTQCNNKQSSLANLVIDSRQPSS